MKLKNKLKTSLYLIASVTPLGFVVACQSLLVEEKKDSQNDTQSEQIRNLKTELGGSINQLTDKKDFASKLQKANTEPELLDLKARIEIAKFNEIINKKQDLLTSIQKMQPDTIEKQVYYAKYLSISNSDDLDSLRGNIIGYFANLKENLKKSYIDKVHNNDDLLSKYNQLPNDYQAIKTLMQEAITEYNKEKQETLNTKKQELATKIQQIDKLKQSEYQDKLDAIVNLDDFADLETEVNEILQKQQLKKLFSDLDTLILEHNVKSTFYKGHDALAAYYKLREDLPNLYRELQISEKLQNKYQITLLNQGQTQANQETGVISNLQLMFTKDNHSKTVTFTLNGFKTFTKQQTNNKNNFLTIKQLDTSVTNLFPSLVAHMLLYIENPNLYNSKMLNASESSQLINYQTLLNKNTNLFTNTTTSFNPALKTKFFEINEATKTKYQYSIVAAKFNDLEGTLGLQVLIENADDNTNSEASIIKEFEFNGFRNTKTITEQQPLISLSLDKQYFEQLNKIINNDKELDKSKIIPNSETSQVILTQVFSDNQIRKMKTFLIKNADVTINDPLNTYKLAEKLKLKDLIGLSQNFILYPFYTRIANDEIKINNIALSVFPSSGIDGFSVKFKTSVDLYVPVTNSYTDLTDNQLDTKHILHIPLIFYIPGSQITIKTEQAGSTSIENKQNN
ncbi:LppA/P72 family lipoprotein [Mycoplasmopsis mustelae]|uniref:LppA/P72 family lipoprotein n=1 Tax=Mycoplasmopsis mustelae TaxID=171289 RepID=A0A4R7UCZ1_9BACT|nr:hypothetical protein [Mycoplasmopsis mustelae]TDV24317.1 LppA/P72 family lipoprotein [Mycoplasmopsis mustelae]